MNLVYIQDTIVNLDNIIKITKYDVENRSYIRFLSVASQEIDCVFASEEIRDRAFNKIYDDLANEMK